MPVLAMVKAKWILFGLEAPQFIWIAAALLLLGTLAQSLRLWWLVACEKLLQTFDASLGQFKEALGQYHTVTGHVRQLAAAAASISKALSETSVTAERTATMAAVQAERFAGTVRRQEDIQQQVAQSMRQYQQVFSQATQATHDLLTRMEPHLHHHTTVSVEQLASVVQTAEAHLARATGRLGDTVHRLDAQLRGVTESLERLQQLGEAHGSPQG